MISPDPTKKPESTSPIGRLDRYSIVQALAAGRVPAMGLRDLQVGRTRELQAIASDLRRAAEGHSTVRFIAGRPESGKTFLLHLARTIALEQGFIVLQADLGPNRRFRSHCGEAKALFRELASHVATRACPAGMSINALLQAWVAASSLAVKKEGASADEIHARVIAKLRPLHELPGGFDFSTVLARFFEAHVSHDDRTCENALRWLRAEYASVDEAHADLGVRSIIDDDSLLRALNLLAVFVRAAGYSGLVVIGDDLALLSRRIKDPAERGENYDFLADLLKDSVEGRLYSTVFLLGIDEDFLEDRIRGLFSNAVLSEWLAPNRFASNGHLDLSSPVIHLQGLRPEHFPDVLRRVHDVFADGRPGEALMSSDDFVDYVEACHARLGDSYFLKPRQVTKHFLDLLHLLDQDPSADWRTLLASARLEPEVAERPSLELPDPEFRPGHAWFGRGSRLGRRVRHLRRASVLAACALVVALVGIMGWRGLVALVTPLQANLELKYSDVRGGLRMPVDESIIPLTSDQYFSVLATLSDMRHVYVLVMDANGHIFYPPTGTPVPQQYTDQLQLPGGQQMWSLPNETGTLTVMLFASKRALDNLDELKRRVASLGGVPRLSPDTMFVLRDGMIELRTNPQGRPGLEYENKSDPGLLRSLQDVFGHEFDAIGAVSIPLRRNVAG
ncbi:MAG: DUF2791 family P-loop domain-containing protein [Planctomycetes bacterium]|nr:DUF2791 family P-loop domain-containing protein [Planctomycetota bacterium]